MPVIQAYADHPTHPYVRVQVDWADVPAVTHAAVYRVDVATGECTPLRPYICYDGWELLLSCGHGIFWDTEAPFDREFYYITSSEQAPCISAVAVQDDFTRVVAPGGWGNATPSGQLWTVSGGAATDYSVNGSVGIQSLGSVNVSRRSNIDGPIVQVLTGGTVRPGVVATGAPINLGLMARFQSAATFYLAEVQFELAGTVTARLRKSVASVFTTVASVATGIPYTATTAIQLEFEINGSDLILRAWDVASPRPVDPTATASDTDITVGGGGGFRSILSAGNTNVLPVAAQMDNFFMLDTCVPCQPVTATDPTSITIASTGEFWLKDPVRPCHDRPVPLCQTGSPLLPICGGSGILFIGIGPEVYPANGFSLRPMNRRRNIAVTRPRGDATTALRLQTVTFTDRDDVLQLAAPGTPLLFQGPAEYGVPDRYMDVKDVQVSPDLPDLRIQLRSEVLPYDTVDRPAGPTQGICGARVADICALYPTWDDLAAAGFSWDDLIAGQADPVSASPNRRTWGDVNTEFADWAAVDTGGRTWHGLEVGD